MENFTDYRLHVGSSPTKFFKSTLFESPHLLLGLNCLEPGQAQTAHQHAGQDKVYFVVEGQGEFSVGDQSQQAGPGGTVWAPAGVAHSVANIGSDRLILLVGIAPWK